MRITEKKENGFYELKEEREIYGWENGIRLVQIVGRVEDIEEKWGISIDLVDRILDYLDEVYLDNSDKPFYVKYLDGIDTVTPVYMQLDRRNKRLLETYSADGSGPTEYPFSEYGKTWALTREELE